MLIGPKGQTMKEIRKKSGAQVEIVKDAGRTKVGSKIKIIYLYVFFFCRKSGVQEDYFYYSTSENRVLLVINQHASRNVRSMIES